MENGNGLDVQATGRALWPWERVGVQPEPMPEAVNIPGPPPLSPTPTKDIHAWKRTPEGKAKMSASMKAGWARRKARLASRLAKAEREAEASTKESSIDVAIQYHLNAINTLRAAKALLK